MTAADVSVAKCTELPSHMTTGHPLCSTQSQQDSMEQGESLYVFQG